ncbi:hypothetical protein MKW92_042332, partial [Papaver armeniacum]
LITLDDWSDEEIDSMMEILLLIQPTTLLYLLKKQSLEQIQVMNGVQNSS